MGNLPVVEHGTEFFHRTIKKSLFFFGEFGFRVSKQLAPFRFATPYLPIPPEGACIQRLLFGLADPGHDPFCLIEQWTRDHPFAQPWKAKHQGCQQSQPKNGQGNWSGISG